MRKLLLAALLTMSLLVPSLANESTKVPGISQELRCLVDNIYHEARGESFKGKVAVAMVTINRTKSERFPTTICGVVYQKGQFTWTTKRKKITNFNDWIDSLLAATMAMEDSKLLGNFTATYYHNDSVNPGWKLRKIAKIGRHIFYS